MQIPVEHNPLVTFALVGFNQEKFIAEAITSALNQDYKHLEILVFDDASTDRTFQIAREIAADYTGPHELKINQNQRNLGLIGNINAVLSASRGEIIVIAAGDDISVPERTRIIVEFWKNSGRPSFIYSGTVRIDEHGKMLERVRPKNMLMDDSSVAQFLEVWPNVTGAASAIHKDIFEAFGPLGSSALVEDRSFAFRGILLNGARYLDQDLVRYRTSGISDSQEFSKTVAAKLAHRHREMQWIRSFYQQAREDLEGAQKRRDDLPWEQLDELCQRKIIFANFMLQLISSSWTSRIFATRKALGIALQTREKMVIRELLKLTTIYALYIHQDASEASP